MSPRTSCSWHYSVVPFASGYTELYDEQEVPIVQVGDLTPSDAPTKAQHRPLLLVGAPSWIDSTVCRSPGRYR